MRVIGRQRLALILSAVLLTTVFVLYFETFASMADVWFKSSTFVHGMLILPMSAYLVWRKRAAWLPLTAKPSALGVLALVAAVVAWVLAELVAVQVVAQLAFIAMLVAIVIAVMGIRVANVLRFPLFYAFFAVPFGDFLVPVLMDWTADATVIALQLTGIPVYREGNFFALPSGNFEVIEACSGVKYLIVMAVLGLYFVHETYRSWTRRALFLAAVGVSIVVANWLRAYVVVLVAHLTQMEYGTGQSHLYIGWVIFLLVITALFWIGHRYEDGSRRSRHGVEMSHLTTAASQRGSIDIAVVFALALVALVAGAALPDRILGRAPADVARPMLPAPSGAWTGPAPPSFGYAPVSNGASSVLAAAYADRGASVEVHIVFYAEQQQGGELVGWHSRPVDAETWRRYRATVDHVPLGDDNVAVRSQVIANESRDLLLWYWYDVGGRLTSSPEFAKLLQAWQLLRGHDRGDALVVLATDVEDRRSGDAGSRLRRFMTDNAEDLRTCLRPDAQARTTCVAGAN